MKLFRWMVAFVMALTCLAKADVPELLELVPEAKGYQLIAKFNPLQYANGGYDLNQSLAISGTLQRVGYLVKLTDKEDKTTWVFTAMDAFTDNPARTLVPDPSDPPIQCMVDNLEVASNHPGVKTGKFPKGNVEIWGGNYNGQNAANIPGATGSHDFGDKYFTNGNYGSFQVHNFLEKQTCFAFNHFLAGNGCDLGIGNYSGTNPDWTFAKNGGNYKNAVIYVMGQFKDFKLNQKAELDATRADIIGITDKDPLTYQPGETMTFTLKVDCQGQSPTNEYYIKWSRSGDDRKTQSGMGKVIPEEVTITTTLDTPGFVRIYATLVDKNGKPLMRKNRYGRQESIYFDGGAAVQPEKLTGTPEPADFDAFWARQKARLDAVPLKYEMKPMPSSTKALEVYAVKVDCAGARPVTGYLTIPAKAKEKSLGAIINFDGYGFRGIADTAPTTGSFTHIEMRINAHGYDLGASKEYYQKFAEDIKSNGKGYAFDPIQNSDPEKAYFNGMTLRVMRALQFLKQLPQWNGKELIAQGGSQGGLQTIWAAGLDPDVTFARPGIPWCCDLGGTKNFQRISGGWRIEYTTALDYYDPINFAKRIKCPVDITRAGLGDYVCPPSGVTVFFNNLKSNATIRYFQGSTHGFVPKNPQIFTKKK